MPFDISCTNCKRTLRVPDDGAGKHVKCPQCQTVVLAPQSASQYASVGGSVAEMWHVKGGDGQTYGPVARTELDNWCREGRLAANSQLLRDGGNQWQWATDLYPHLAQSTALSSTSVNGHAGGSAGPSPYGGYNPYGGAPVNPYSPGGYSVHS